MSDTSTEESFVTVKPASDDVINLVTLSRGPSIEDITEDCSTECTLNNNNHDTEIEIIERENNCINNGSDMPENKSKKRYARKGHHSNDPKLALSTSVQLEMSECYLKSHKCPSKVTRRNDENDENIDQLLMSNNQHGINDTGLYDRQISKARPSALVENLDYQLLKGKKGLDLLTAIEMQTNANLAKMDMCLSSSDFSDRESPRRAQRTRSVESALIDQPKTSTPISLKRPRSVDFNVSRTCDPYSTADTSFSTGNIGPTASKVARLTTTSNDTSADAASSPIELKDKKNYKSSGYENRGHSRSSKTDHNSKRRSHSDKNRSRRTTIGVQVHLKDQHSTLKLMDPRPILTLNGNLWYPPYDVSKF